MLLVPVHVPKHCNVDGLAIYVLLTGLYSEGYIQYTNLHVKYIGVYPRTPTF